MKIIFLFLVALSVQLNAQKTKPYLAVDIYPNSKKANPASLIFDEIYLMGYNTKGQLLYGYTYITEAADHNGYGISLYDATTNKTTQLLSIGMEDSLNVFTDFDHYFKTNQSKINSFIKKYSITGKQPIISLINKKDYTLKKDCKKDYDWYNCTYTALYNKTKSFKIKSEGQPDNKSIPTLYKLISFEKYKIILYNVTQRGWEGTPFVIRFGLF